MTTRRSLVPVMVLGSLLADGRAFGQPEPAWPCFHGPRRDNCSMETGLLRQWPEGGPKLLWTAERLGKGYGTVAIADGMIFTSGMLSNQTCIVALGLDGTTRWRVANGRSWKATMPHAVAYDGARGTPTFSDGKVYHLSECGRLGAFDAADGNDLWSMDVLKAFDADVPKYGLAESVLIDGPKLLCCPGGTKGFLVCLDKQTGKLIWATQGIDGTVGYSSLVPTAQVGQRMYVGMTSAVVFGVQAETGKLLWSVPHRNMRDNNATDPVPWKDFIYAASGYGQGSLVVRLSGGPEVTTETVWSSEIMDSLHGGVVRVQGFLYGSGHDDRKWSCVDLMTGRVSWSVPGKGSLTYADGRLYLLDERGTVMLAETDPRGFRSAGSFKLPSGGSGLYWAHPVICGGRLYIRHDDKLFAYDIRKP